ncbi:MAG: hypothetical protein GX868_09115 [Actinobacteria bacterium]|nr:hypothetical protein [Actinomycetota bacterium]
MSITKADSTDAFVVVDLADAPTAIGVVRCAKKILQDGAVNLARTLTYTYGAFGEKISGASAGINAEGDARDAAVSSFVDEFAPQVNSGALRLTPAKGVTDEDLAAWAESPAALSAEDEARTLGVSTVAAAAAVRELADLTVSVEAGAPGAEAIAAAFNTAGATATVRPLAELLSTASDVVVVGSKAGVLNHDNVVGIGDALVIGSAGLAITARGLAVGKRQGATILPDFVTAAGPALAALGRSDDEIAAAVQALINEVKNHEEGPYLGACYAAERFMATWTEALPFGRPMAA